MRKNWYRFRVVSIVVLVGVFTLLQVYGARWSLPVQVRAAGIPPVDAGAIQGMVRKSNGRGLSNVTVSVMTIPGRGQAPLLIGTANTDNSGKFQLGQIPPGTYNVQASSLSSTAQSRVTVLRNATAYVSLLMN